MTDGQASLEFEEHQIMAFLAPLSELAPATRASKAARPVPKFGRSVIVLAVVAAFGAGAAVATTTSNDPRLVTITERNGTEYPDLICPLPGTAQEGSRPKDFNGIPGLQPGEPCPTFIQPKGDQGSNHREKGSEQP